MSIRISKLENVNGKNDPMLHTNLYGDIEKVDSEPENYMYFDTDQGYDLFVNEDGSKTVAVLAETLMESTNKNDNLDELSNEIKNKFKPQMVTVDKNDKSIIIKDSSENVKLLNDIYNYYANENVKKDNGIVEINNISGDMLYIKLDDSIVLEEDDVLDKLDDNTVKDIATKTGVKLSGSENKDELKGIIKGALNNK